MTGEVYVVASSGLNMRELPDASAEILVVLPKGQFVTRLDNRAWGGTWFRVQAELHMLTFQGYVSGGYVTPYNPAPTPGRPSLAITRENLIALAKNPKADYLPGLVKGFNANLPAYQINTGLRVSHFMAQCAHECDNFRTMEEYASGAAYEGRAALGNTQPGDGVRYKGRGVIQLTGRANYRTYGAALGLDLENNPQLAAAPENAVRVACEYWKRNNLNALADADDISAITRRINGGLNGLEDRQLKLRIAKSIWGGATGV